MEERAVKAVERGLAWCGPIFVAGFICFWSVMGHNLPPPNMMGMTPDQLVSEYYGKYPSIGPGMIGAATFGLFYTIWSCLLASLMRDESGNYSVFTFLELAGGILTGWLLAFCPAMWAACSLLVHQVDPATIKMVHTFTWIIFDCTYMITTMQMVGLGLWTVLNKRQTMFPAWAGWASIAIGVAFVALVIMPFAADGPFAVGGLFNYWIIFMTWLFAFFSVYNFYVLKHVYRSPAEQARAAGRLQTA
ncbi:hypothetical protein [Novosphingobium lentum]|uniref:hypothetical protein n=1 Tax=Novosphingobium lentum TaxID=145287 RepID=UPI0008338528|nr:hypothetical protein [Novosphingobium lentum]